MTSELKPLDPMDLPDHLHDAVARHVTHEIGCTCQDDEDDCNCTYDAFLVRVIEALLISERLRAAPPSEERADGLTECVEKLADAAEVARRELGRIGNALNWEPPIEQGTVDAMNALWNQYRTGAITEVKKA